MPVEFKFTLPTVIILIGIFLGCFLSFMFIIKSIRERSANIFMGLLIFSITMIMFEGWLNYTGLIFKYLHFTNFSEPLNFAIAPLIYLFMSKQLGSPWKKLDWLHLVPFLFWLVYSLYFYLQPVEFKYDSIIMSMNLDLPLKRGHAPFPDNPLKIRNYINELTIIFTLIYLVYTISLLFRKSKELKQSLFKTTNTTLKSIRNSFYHFAILFVLLVLVKLIYVNDTGDHFLFIYFTFMLFMTTYHIVNGSNYFETPSGFLEAPSLKYRKSSLVEDNKKAILKSIKFQMEVEKYFLNPNASVSGLAKKVNETSHNVSQVINEKLNQSFFEMIATYRVEEAKKILRSDEGKKLTIEIISERVGYNSKSAFNSVFKKFTSQTPSSYRDS